MATSQVTLTGTDGPGIAITAGVFTGVTSFTFKDTLVFSMTLENGIVKDIDISAATTITITVSGGSYTVSIS